MSAAASQPPLLETIEVRVEDRIATVTLNRPDAFNAMSPELIGELTVVFGWLADLAPVRAAIVTGAGRAFCAGGDLNWFRTGAEDKDVDLPATVRRGAEVLHQGIIDLARTPFPVIAAINGPAPGAGFSLALACDYRICSEQSFLACAYGRIGVSPDGGMTYFLPRAVGPSRAIELMLDDPNLSPAQALEEKLVSEVVAPEALMDRAREKAAELAQRSPYYVKTAKRLVHSSLDHTLAEHLQHERHGIADGMATEDSRKAVAAFLEGEKHEFTGR